MPSRSVSHSRQQSSHVSPNHHSSKKAVGTQSSKARLPSTSRDPGPRKSKATGTHDLVPKASVATKKEMQKACNETVTVPPQLPDILKQYAKGAMRTQPPDLLSWSGMYFRSMVNGEPLPVKDRLEFPIKESADGLTPGLLRVLDNQMGSIGGKKVSTNEVLKKWRGFGLSLSGFNDVLAKANMTEDNVVEWDKLMPIMACTIRKKFKDGMKVICEVLTDQPDGMEPLMSFQVWWSMYLYLAKTLKKVPDGKIQTLSDYLTPLTAENSGHIGPKDFTSARCPPLE